MTDENKPQKTTKKQSRRRTATKGNPDKIIKKTGAPPQAQQMFKLGVASASTIRTQPRVYSPQYLDSNLNFPRDIRTQNAWNRSFYATNPVVRAAIDMHAAYTTGKFRLMCKDKKILDFFEDMLSKMNFQNTLLEVGVEFFKLGECLEPGTLITMADGTLKPVEQVSRGDMVITHKGRPRKVTDLKTHIHEGNLYKIKSRNSNRTLNVTGNHPIWALKKDQMMCKMPSCQDHKTCWPNSDCCSRDLEWNFDFLPAENLDKNDVVYAPFDNSIEEAPSYINKAWCRLFGIWLAEGCFAKQQNKSGTTLNVQIANSDSEILDEIKELIDVLGFNCHSKIVQETVELVTITGGASNAQQLAAQFLEHGGEYSNAKKLSLDIMKLEPTLQKEILASYINGDGSVDRSNGQIQLSTNSLNLRNQLNILFARCGYIGVWTDHLPKYAGAERQYTPTNRNYRITIPAHQAREFKDKIITRKAELLRFNEKNQKYSTFLDNGVVRKIQSVSTESYNGWVFNLEVEEDHSYVAEGVAVHNCYPYAELDENHGVLGLYYDSQS